MRALATGLGLTMLVAATAAVAQVQQLPATSRAEQQVNTINRSIAVEQQNRSAAQQNQFEVNSLRNQLSRPAPPPLVPYGPGPGLGR